MERTYDSSEYNTGANRMIMKQGSTTQLDQINEFTGGSSNTQTQKLYEQ